MLIVESLTKTFPLEDGFLCAVDQTFVSSRRGGGLRAAWTQWRRQDHNAANGLGLLDPDSGYAEVEGVRTADDPIAVKSRLGFVSASDGVYPWLSVREMLLYFGDLYGVDPDVAARAVKTWRLDGDREFPGPPRWNVEHRPTPTRDAGSRSHS